MIQSFNSSKEAISNLFCINKKYLKRLKVSGIQNDGVYSYRDRIYKISASRTEFLASKRLIGKKFKNVVQVYGSYECNIIYDNKFYRSYIIEEERLYRYKNKYAFYDLDVSFASVDINKRLPYFVSILNGLAELSSIGIIHHDLHTLNVMYDKNNNFKIIDFGYVKLKKTYNYVNIRAKTIYKKI